jgi:2-keto-4-pentenoate hydratase/2-oxohepta-3-ene-1,7-dioic acid hydratase in catechol pathway
VRLATFVGDGGAPRVGVVVDGEALVAVDAPATMQELIEAGPDGLAAARAAVAAARPADKIALTDVRLLAPLPVPAQIRDCLVFEEHLRNAFARGAELTGEAPRPIPDVWFEQPIYYKANRFSVVGPGADVVWPAYSQVMDYELELACVIGRGGRDIAPDDAPEHVFGYTIFNDASARDAQMREMAGQLGPAKGKDFDTGNVLGPWIVTPDELGDPQALAMTARVNGEEWSRGSSAAMHHSFADIIAHVSASETLHPGEVLGSGTVGTGCGLELGRFLADGDVVELEVEGIGVLRNRFVTAP